MSAAQTFNVTVIPNHPPVLSPIPNFTVTPGQTVSFQAQASDVDFGERLTFSLDPGAPAGATINASTGAFSWTPTTGGNFPITVRVTDNGTPPASTTQSFTVTVKANQPPTLAPISSATIPLGQAVNVQAQGSDSDGDTLTYSLDPGFPSGASINATTGAFSWTPTTAGSFPITVRVTDNGTPALSATQPFTVTVKANQPPVLASIADIGMQPGQGVSFQAQGSDSDGDTLTYSLDPGFPSGASINATTGAFSWTPTTAGNFPITVRVTDNGSPALSTTQSFTVHVVAPAPLVTVSNVQILSKRGKVTSIVLSFSGALDQGTAGGMSHYTLASSTRVRRKGRVTVQYNRFARLGSATYNPSNATVMLVPGGKLALNKTYQLVVSGLLDTQGRAIDAKHNGQSGGSFIALLSKSGVQVQ
jgi:hypothetical protein